MKDYARAVEAGKKGTTYLMRRQREDGYMMDEKGRPSTKVSCYYKTIWAFASSGQLNRANRALDVVQAKILRKNGDFGDKEQRKGDEGLEWRYYTYPNIWFVIGSQKIGRFDISIPGIDYLMKYFDPNTGGFCNEKPYPEGNDVEDSVTASANGLACLFLGRLEQARKAGDFLIGAMKKQPEPKRSFYTTMNAEKKEDLITDFPKSEAIYRLVDYSQKEQICYMLGLPVGFLSKLFLATSESKYLAAAKSYFECTKLCRDDAYYHPAGGKSGFSAAGLWRITRAADVRKAAERELSYLIKTQDESGVWNSFPDKPMLENGAILPYEVQIDVTGEFVVWINEILGELTR